MQQDGFYLRKNEIRSIGSWPGLLIPAPSILLLEKGETAGRPALFPVSQSRLGTLLPLLIRGNNYESGQVIKLKHKWLHEPGWLFYKLFPGLIKEKYGSAHPQCHSAGKNEEKKAPATNFNKSMGSFKHRKKAVPARVYTCSVMEGLVLTATSVAAQTSALFVCRRADVVAAAGARRGGVSAAA